MLMHEMAYEQELRVYEDQYGHMCRHVYRHELSRARGLGRAGVH